MSIHLTLSLCPSGLKYTSANQVAHLTVQVRCILAMVALSQGHLTWVPGSQHPCHVTKTDSPWASRGHPIPHRISPVLTGLSLSPEVPFFRRMMMFGAARHVWTPALHLVPTLKMVLCHTLASLDAKQIPAYELCQSEKTTQMPSARNVIKNICSSICQQLKVLQILTSTNYKISII